MSESTYPSITVIVPLYNKVNEVERSLQSIFSQTITDYELLIIDGGSTDGSLEIAESYLKDSRIQIIHQKSKGLPAARNEAISHASGELIAFLDADDEWHPDFLETIIHLYQKYPGAGIYATAYERFSLTTAKPSPVKGLSESFEGYLPSWFSIYVKSGFPPFCPCSVVLHWDMFSKTGYFNPNSRMAEDVEMWVKAALNVPIVFTKEVHARYHLFADNKMSTDYYPIEKLPPVEYLDSISESTLQNREDHSDILLAKEYLNLITAYFNLGAGNKRYAKQALAQSSSKEFAIRRTGLRILSILPAFIGKRIIKIYASVPYVKDRIRILVCIRR
ncbi:MAG: glycosyltransferase [Methanocorpusculum parvum]|nr:glycosyltransferase [Methanocorpusculum parvum]